MGKADRNRHLASIYVGASSETAVAVKAMSKAIREVMETAYDFRVSSSNLGTALDLLGRTAGNANHMTVSNSTFSLNTPPEKPPEPKVYDPERPMFAEEQE